jgi:methionyl-tRNA formyltransferase
MTKVVFFGSEEFSAPSLEMLLHEHYEVVAVVTKPDSGGRGHHANSPRVAEIARQWNTEHNAKIQILQPTKLADIYDDLSKLSAEIGVLVSYGKIVPESVIQLFPRGIVNFHPSQLPQYRGPSPIETAILHGDRETGLTLMALAREMDAGPIYIQEPVTLTGHETKPELYRDFAQRGAELLRDNLPQIIRGDLHATDQAAFARQHGHDPLPTYCQMIQKADGDLDPATETADEIERKIRAFLGWPKTRLDFHGVTTIITRVKVLRPAPGDAWPDVVKCADGTALQIQELINPKSGKTMSTSKYLRGLHA